MTGSVVLALAAALAILILVASAVKIVGEHERGVVFRLGRPLEPTRGPGLAVVVPLVDRMVKVDLREIAIRLPVQDVVARDGARARVAVAVGLRVLDPAAALVGAADFRTATKLMVEACLRSVIGERDGNALLSDRREIAIAVRELADEAARSWGAEVSSVELEDVSVSGDAPLVGPALPD